MPDSRYWDCREACWVDWEPQTRQVEAVVPAQAAPADDRIGPASGPIIPASGADHLAPSRHG